MKSLIITTTALALTSGALLATPADAAVYRGKITPHERVLIARDSAHVAALKRRIYANGHATMAEKAKLRVAQARHKALVWRLSHN